MALAVATAPPWASDQSPRASADLHGSPKEGSCVPLVREHAHKRERMHARPWGDTHFCHTHHWHASPRRLAEGKCVPLAKRLATPSLKNGRFPSPDLEKLTTAILCSRKYWTKSRGTSVQTRNKCY
ncbi:Hypothetical predicted protein [Podarcis lilfordi]|uniref:Uncharacterized protein n=1 Tax=Podarcis lilfordi TaxID=74358 RepID=A0AA35P0K8_9SAUR|nr:Hypothetical predicted protein [Podarcis lilfordi]